VKVKNIMDEIVKCSLLNREISEGDCFDLCNVAVDDILFDEDKDKINDWNKAQEVCKRCGRYE